MQFASIAKAMWVLCWLGNIRLLNWIRLSDAYMLVTYGNIDPINDLSPGQHQATIRTNAGML